MRLTTQDLAGNSAQTQVSLPVDNHPPQATLIDYPTDTVNGNTSKVAVDSTWTGSDPDGITPVEKLVYQYKLEGHLDYQDLSGWSSETSKTYMLSSGNYAFKVRAKDEAGNYPEENEDPPLRGYLTNVQEDIEPRLIWDYSKRWRIENFFKENLFLHLDHLPGIDLAKINLLLYYKKIAYHAVNAFKKSLPDEHKNKHIQTIVEDFLEAEAFVKKRGDRIRVSFMGHRYEDILQPIFSKIDHKLYETT